MAFLGSETHTVTRFLQTTYPAGDPINTIDSTFPVIGTIHPATGKILDLLPEGFRAGGSQHLYTSTELNTVTSGKIPDTVLHRGLQLQVTSKKDWISHLNGVPHFEYLLAQPGEDEP